MKKIITILLLAVTLTSCATTSLTSAQAWLNDPKNQQMISQIAQTAITLVTAFAAERNGRVTAVGKLAETYPDVPAGAVAAIAKNPHAYVKH